MKNLSTISIAVFNRNSRTILQKIRSYGFSGGWISQENFKSFYSDTYRKMQYRWITSRTCNTRRLRIQFRIRLWLRYPLRFRLRFRFRFRMRNESLRVERIHENRPCKCIRKWRWSTLTLSFFYELALLSTLQIMQKYHWSFSHTRNTTYDF